MGFSVVGSYTDSDRTQDPVDEASDTDDGAISLVNYTVTPLYRTTFSIREPSSVQNETLICLSFIFFKEVKISIFYPDL